MFKLSEETKLRVVVRGISEILFRDETKHNLIEVWFEVTSVDKMHKNLKEPRLRYRNSGATRQHIPNWEYYQIYQTGANADQSRAPEGEEIHSRMPPISEIWSKPV